MSRHLLDSTWLDDRRPRVRGGWCLAWYRRACLLGSVMLLLLFPSAYGLAEPASPIPLAELGARADAQQPAPAPVLAAGQATLAAPLQALRGEIGPAGLSVESTSVSEGGGRFRLMPTHLDKGEAPLSLPSGTVRLRDQAVVLDRGPLTEVLSASGDGLRQDFVVAQAPAGDGALTLTLALEGATASADPAGVALTLPGGRRLSYHRLHITDAAGQVLDGTLAIADAHTLTITVADATAHYPLTIDPTISDADWQVLNPGIPGANSTVRALAYDNSSGRLYVGGDFSAIGTVLARRIAQWDGSAWSALGTGMDFGVYALAVSGSTLYAGGSFTSAGGTTANRIAQWNGSAWSALGTGINGTVFALAVSGSTLYAGGGFLSAGGVADTKYIAQWNGSAWSALGTGMSGTVNALAVSGSILYAGGAFTTADGSAANRIAKWSGSAWSALGSGLNNTVNALAVSGSTLYVSGSFTSAGGTAADRIAQWSGSAWSALGTGMNGTVNALAVSGTDLYAGGDFTTAGGTDANRIAQWDGSAWSALGTGMDLSVLALAVSDGTLYAGGYFSSAGGVADTKNIAQWNGSAWSALGMGMDGAVNALAVSGTDLYVGGLFTTAGGNLANDIAKWNGSAWSALGSGLNSPVYALAVSGTDLYVGGNFTSAGGQFSPYAAAVNLSPCGPGIPYTTGQWQQFALPCVPSASPASIANVLGNAATDVVNLPDSSYGSKWTLYGRNATNSGNVQLAKTAELASEAGYWFKSLTAPVDGKLQIAAGTATPVETGITGCQSANGCAVIPVATGTAAARMIGNPFPYNVDWSQVRVRVGGIDGEVYTPSEAFDADLVNKQIWIWNGASYETWDDDADPGYLHYFKSFFIKVMASGVGQTIDLLIPAAASSVPVSALPAGFAERLAATTRAWSGAVLDWLIPPAAADEPAAGWKVRLRVENPKTGAKARALLGQRAGAEPGYDPADLTALAPFASPYLTLVFPQPGWGANKGDYGSDFRPADGVAEQWNLELRSNPVGSQVVLRWEGDPAVLARSRLIDGKTVIDPANPAYANGYPLTLKTSVRALRWEYLGD